MKSKIIIYIASIILGVQLFAQPPGAVFRYKNPYENSISKEEYKERRQKLISSLNPGTALILFSSDFYNNLPDCKTYGFVEPNLFYLTGTDDPGTVLILSAGLLAKEDNKPVEILFITERTPKEMFLLGPAMTISEAKTITGINEVKPIRKLFDELDSISKYTDSLIICRNADYKIHRFEFYDKINNANNFDFLLCGMNLGLFKEKLEKLNIKLSYDYPYLNKLREEKSDAEINLLRKAVDKTSKAIISAIKSVKPGITEYYVQSKIEQYFRENGNEGPSFPTIVGSGRNSCILHYTNDSDTIRHGSLVVIDCGTGYMAYKADLTRTFPASGKFTPEQKIIYNIVLEAQDSAIKACRAGFQFLEPHRRAFNVIDKKLKELGIVKLQGETEMFFPHQSIHHIGLSVHDPSISGKLTEGNVVTVEPGIYIPEGTHCNPKWWNIGIRIEDNILITSSNPVILSSELPRKTEDIEKLFKK